MRFVLRTGSDSAARADIAMLTALGLPGGGILSVGDTFVKVVPGDVPVANELHLPPSAFANGAGRPGSAVDASRAVVPRATNCTLMVNGSTLDEVPSELVGAPAMPGHRFPTSLGEVVVTSLSPAPSVLAAETHLSLLNAYDKDQDAHSKTTVPQLKNLGAEILARKYETQVCLSMSHNEICGYTE